MKLISMTDFVLQQANYTDVSNISEKYAAIWNYARFLKQPLKLEMFVPCDEDGNHFPEPKKEHYTQDEIEASVLGCDYLDYQKYKNKVLFEGFYWEGDYAVCMTEDEMIYIDDEFMQNMTIDKFLTTIITDLQLTPTAIKQIQP